MEVSSRDKVQLLFLSPNSLMVPATWTNRGAFIWVPNGSRVIKRIWRNCDPHYPINLKLHVSPSQCPLSQITALPLSLQCHPIEVWHNEGQAGQATSVKGWSNISSCRFCHCETEDTVTHPQQEDWSRGFIGFTVHQPLPHISSVHVALKNLPSWTFSFLVRGGC